MSGRWEAPPAARQMTDIIAYWAERTPLHPALAEGAAHWSYADLATCVAATGAALQAVGVRAGDRVMLVGENSRALVAAYFAVAGLGAWPSVVNPRLSEREIGLIREHCGPRVVIYGVGNSPRARLHAGAESVPLPIEGVGGLAIGPRDEAVAPEPVVADTPVRVASLVYTSGTTGLPKAVMLTHANLMFAARTSGKLRELNPQDRFLAVLPMSHSLGLAGVLLGTLFYGGTVHLAPRFDPAATAKALERGELTVLLGSPSMYALLLEHARARGAARLPTGDLRLISSAGAPLDAALKQAVEALLGLPLHNGYGITECSPTVTQTWPGESRADLSVGRPSPEVQLRLVGAQGDVPPGEVGELLVRGPNVMLGYYRDPVATAAVIDAEGWFRTGDLARLEAGRLFIAGRAKELIIRSGFNVYPAEVEAVLNSHPAVLQSAVLGRPVGGDDEIVAFVQLRPEASATARDLADHAARLLTPYKQPTEIRLIAELPTSAPGKIKKAELAALLAVPMAQAS